MMHKSKGLVSRLAVASCRAPKFRALGKSVESHSPSLILGNSHQMQSARVYSWHIKFVITFGDRRMQVCNRSRAPIEIEIIRTVRSIIPATHFKKLVFLSLHMYLHSKIFTMDTTKLQLYFHLRLSSSSSSFIVTMAIGPLDWYEYKVFFVSMSPTSWQITMNPSYFSFPASKMTHIIIARYLRKTFFTFFALIVTFFFSSH